MFRTARTLKIRKGGNVIGIPSIGYETWSGEIANLPVEYVHSNKKYLGLLQRPVGRRNWTVLTTDGNQLKIDRYRITFEWPVIPGKEVNEYSVEDVIKLEDEAKQFSEKIATKVDDIWSEFWTRDQNSRSEQNQERPLVTGFDIAEFLTSNGKKLAQEIGVHDTITPILVYACHLFLGNSPMYFQASSVRGYICRTDDQVKQEKDRKNKEEIKEKARLAFVEKVKNYLLTLPEFQEQHSYSTEKKVQPPTNVPEFNAFDKSFISRIKIYALKTDSDYMGMKTNPPAIPIGGPNSIVQSNAFSSTSPLPIVDYGSDTYVTENFLNPIGIGNQPHDAFKLLVHLKIFDKHENIHVLRWRNELKPLAELSEKVARAIHKYYLRTLEGTPTDIEMPEFQDPFESFRYDFTKMPVFILGHSLEELSTSPPPLLFLPPEKSVEQNSPTLIRSPHEALNPTEIVRYEEMDKQINTDEESVTKHEIEQHSWITGISHHDFGISVDLNSPSILDVSEWIYIHLANPTRFIAPDDELDHVAQKRSRSIFFTRRNNRNVTKVNMSTTAKFYSILPPKTTQENSQKIRKFKI